MLALALADRRERLRVLAFVPALAVALSVAAGMPATDLRHAYGCIISVPFLFVLALLPHPEPADSSGSRHETALATDEQPAGARPRATS